MKPAITPTSALIQLSDFGPEVVAALCKSLSNTIEVMFARKVTPKPAIAGTSQALNQGTFVTGIIGVTQAHHEGYFYVSFQKTTICKIVSEFYGRPFDKIEAPVWEAVGELTNVIYSGFKKDMNENKGLGLKKSLPGVVIGGNQTVYNIDPGKILLIPFDLEGEEQRIGLSMKVEAISS